MKDIESIKEDILNSYSIGQYSEVVKLYEANSIIIYEDYQLIGLIAFSYQKLSKYDLAIRIIENNIGVIDYSLVDINDFDLIYLVIINCYMEIGKEHKGFKYAKHYIKLEGKNIDIIRANDELIKRLVKNKLKRLFWGISGTLTSVYVVDMVLKKGYNLDLLPKHGSLVVVLLFVVFLYLFYQSKVIDNLVLKYYQKL